MKSEEVNTEDVNESESLILKRSSSQPKSSFITS
jgi:hypothetical protein